MHVLLAFGTGKSYDDPKAALNQSTMTQLKYAHVIWELVAVIGLNLSSCSSERFYPVSFLLNFALFAVFYFYVHFTCKKGFGNYVWQKGEEKQKELFEA